MDVSEYATYDATGLAALIRDGAVSSREVAEVALAAHERSRAQLAAVVEVYDDFVADTASLPLGSLRGVPFLTKDVGPDFGGRLLEFGSRLCAGAIAEHDSAYGRLVKATGVNLMGRANAPEYSMALCAENRLHGATSNPWRSGYATSGSSGGSAAAVAAGVVPLAHASDMGGSTRGPAAWCGTVGLQPSRGRIPAGPDEAESGWGMAQSFVVTRSVRDTAAMLDHLAQPQPGDPFVIWRPAGRFASHLDGPRQRLRIAWSARPLMDAPVDPEIAAAVESVAHLLAGLGHEVAEAAPPVDLDAIDRALLEIWYFRFDRWLDELAAHSGRRVGPETVERATLRFYEFARRQDPDDFLGALEQLNTIRRATGPFFTDHDIWLSPTCAQVAQPHGTFGMDLDLAPREFLLHEQRPCQFMILYNVTGQPAISLPLAQHSNGLPIGVQLGARSGEEHLLIQLAADLERAAPWHGRVPPLHVSRSAA